jgi:hypothetical protein
VNYRRKTGSGLSGTERISAERFRQISKEGWTAEHDNEHDGSEMALAAICYAAHAAGERVYLKRVHEYQNESTYTFSDPWPWEPKWDKRSTGTPSRSERIRDLEKAGALIAAEIDRLLRVAQPTPEAGDQQ